MWLCGAYKTTNVSDANKAKQIVLNNPFFTNYIDTYVNPSNKQLEKWKEEHYNGDEKQKQEEREYGKGIGTYEFVMCDIDMAYRYYFEPREIYNEDYEITEVKPPISTIKPFYKYVLDLNHTHHLDQ